MKIKQRIWKSKTYEDCFFRDGGYCRNGPPSENGNHSHIMTSDDLDLYQLACSEWEKDNDTT